MSTKIKVLLGVVILTSALSSCQTAGRKEDVLNNASSLVEEGLENIEKLEDLVPSESAE